MLDMNSINIVYDRQKKIETCTFKLNIRENRILLSTGVGATCRYNAYFIRVSLVSSEKLVCDVTDGCE